MTRKAITTKWPGRGDLVKGHRVFAYGPGLPAVPATVTKATDATIEITVETALAIIYGLPKRSVWTWRAKAGRYQQRGTSGSKSMALLLNCSLKAKGGAA